MFEPNPLAGRAARVRETQGGGPPPGGYGPPGAPPPGGYGPPGAPPPGGGYGPPGSGGYGPPGGHGPPGSGGFGGYGAPPPGKPITGSAATIAMHAMTIDPMTGLPRGERPPASTAAVLALVCGILLCLGPFTGVPAVVAGVLGRKAARDYPQTVGGQRMATAGLALGIINLVLSSIAIAVAIWHFLEP